MLKIEVIFYLDLIMKNMIGVYDIIKYGLILFIYVGLFLLVFCLFYFVSWKVLLKNKFLYGGFFVIFIVSFYFVLLNLFWYGMYVLNMFLFCYVYLFFFLVFLFVGKGWEKIE